MRVFGAICKRFALNLVLIQHQTAHSIGAFWDELSKATLAPKKD